MKRSNSIALSLWRRLNAIARSRLALVSLLLAAAFLTQPALAQGHVTYAYVNVNNANLTSGVVTGTAAISARTNLTAGSGILNATAPASTNFPASWYSPLTPALTNFQRFELNNSAAGSTGAYTLTFTFTTPVTNPVFNFSNVDAGTFNFSTTTQVGGGAVSVTRLSGNNELELTGTTANSTPGTPVLVGCEANDGSNPNGGCGSIQLNGAYTTVVIRATDTDTNTGSGDGHALAVFLHSDNGDAPASYGGAPHSGSTAIRLGAARDVESAYQSSADASGDDASGGDDEDALASVTAPVLAPGGAHTQSGISCTGTGSLYGYIDFNRDGDFLDTGERSSVTTCASGTASLSWTMSSSAGALVSGASFLRIRYASVSTQIDSPTENAATGEVEDYPITLQGADVAITKSDGVASISSGSSTIYTIVVTNNGADSVTGATLTDAAATGITVTSVACAPTPGQCTAGTTPTIAQLQAGYALPALTSGQTYRLSVTATITALSGSVVNIATIAVPSGVGDPVSTNNSASDTNTVTARVAGTPPTLSCSSGTTVFDWDAVSWLAGSTSNSYSIVGIGSTSFDVALSGGAWLNSATWGGQNPARQSGVTGGLSPAQFSLAQLVNFTSTAGTATTTISLPTAVPGVQFQLFDVDFVASQFADRVTITGSFGGNSVTPTLTNGTANYVIGNSAYGDVDSGNTSNAANVVVTFSAPVDTIVISYGSHSLAPSDPSAQGIALHDITFCRPTTTVTLTKIVYVVSDGVSATDPKAIPGATMRYCLLATNNGSATIANVAANDNLPTEVTYVPGSMSSGSTCAGPLTAEDDDAAGLDESDPFGMSFAGTTVTATAATLAPSASFSMVFNVTVD